MPIRYLHGIIALALLLAAACESGPYREKNPGPPKGRNRFRFERTGYKHFPLDASALPEMRRTAQVYEETDERGLKRCLVTFSNAYNNALYFYDCSTGEFVKKEFFQKEGPDGVGLIFSHFVLNKDSVLLMHKSGVFPLHLALRSGKVLKRWKLTPDRTKAEYAPAPFIDHARPVIAAAGRYFISGSGMGEPPGESRQNRPVTICVEPDGDEISYTGYYPDHYRKAHWGETSMRFVYHAYWPQGQAIVYSFPASHQLYYKPLHSDSLHAVYGGSAHIPEIAAYSDNRHSLNFDVDAYFRYECTTPAYGPLYYDPWREVFYRLYVLGVSLEDFSRSQQDPAQSHLMFGRTGIVVLDKNLGYMGDTLFEELRYFPNAFVTPQGLHITEVTPGNTGSEDTLSYALLSFNPLVK